MQSPNRHFGEYPPTAICAHRPPITNCVRVQQFRLLEVVTSGKRRKRGLTTGERRKYRLTPMGPLGFWAVTSGAVGAGYSGDLVAGESRDHREDGATRHGDHGDVRALIRDTPSLATIGHTYAPTEFAHGRKQGPSRSASPASGLLIRNRRCPSSISTRSPRPGEPAFAGSSRPPVGAACRRPNLRQ